MPLSITYRRVFFLFCHVSEEPYFLLLFCGPFFVPCTSMLSSSVRFSATVVLPYRKHSTAQRNHPAQSRKASTCRRECDNASKETESIYYSCIAVPQAQHITAQSARTKPQINHVPIRVRQRKQAGREHLLYCSTASAAQRNQPAQSRKASTCGLKCDNASKKTVGESQHESSSVYTAC